MNHKISKALKKYHIMNSDVFNKVRIKGRIEYTAAERALFNKDFAYKQVDRQLIWSAIAVPMINIYFRQEVLMNPTRAPLKKGAHYSWGKYLSYFP